MIHMMDENIDLVKSCNGKYKQIQIYYFILLLFNRKDILNFPY